LQDGGGPFADRRVRIGGQNAQRLDAVVGRQRSGFLANRQAAILSRASGANFLDQCSANFYLPQ
jgi:hypothetical protein